MSTPEVIDRVKRNQALLDQLIESMVNRAGSEDTGLAIVKFIESFPDDETRVSELMFLVLSAVERAAQYSTVVDIWDPKRRIDPVKALRLGRRAQAAFVDLHREMKHHSTS